MASIAGCSPATTAAPRAARDSSVEWAGQPDDSERLGVGDTDRPSRLHGALLHQIVHPLPRTTELRAMARQGAGLAVEHVGDGDGRIRFERARQVQPLDLVGAPEVGEVQRTRRRTHRVDRRPAADPVVTVVHVSVTEEHRRRIRAHDHFGSHPADALDEIGAQLMVVVAVAIGTAEHRDRFDVEDARGGVHLAGADPGQLGSVDAGVVRTLVALVHQHEVHVRPGAGPAGQ